MNVMKLIYSFICITMISFCLKAQDRDVNLDVYIQKYRYSLSDEEEKEFNNYIFIGNYYLDRNKENRISLYQLEQGLNRLIPNREDSVFVSIDLENAIYNNLKSPDREKRKIASYQFVEMIRFIKEKRPNIKVGIYGLPFSFNYESQKLSNHYRDLKCVLKEVDYISPSLYFSYSEEQQTDAELYQYVQKNLNLFLKYAHKLNKPLYLYTWYLVHPYNKQYGMQIVSKERMKTFLDYVQSIDYKGTKVKGVIWWESSNSSYKLRDEPQKSITEILKEYTKSIKK